MARRTIMRKEILTILSALSLSAGLSAQTVDTTYIYKDRKDSLNAAVFVGHQENSISRGKTLRTELISASGLQKMACCNLAESFENSASVTVGYSDAVTGRGRSGFWVSPGHIPRCWTRTVL